MDTFICRSQTQPVEHEAIPKVEFVQRGGQGALAAVGQVPYFKKQIKDKFVKDNLSLLPKINSARHKNIHRVMLKNSFKKLKHLMLFQGIGKEKRETFINNVNTGLPQRPCGFDFGPPQ